MVKKRGGPLWAVHIKKIIIIIIYIHFCGVFPELPKQLLNRIIPIYILSWTCKTKYRIFLKIVFNIIHISSYFYFFCFSAFKLYSSWHIGMSSASGFEGPEFKL